jgi:hypothetical protein
MVRTNRSAKQFARGQRGGVLTTRMPCTVPKLDAGQFTLGEGEVAVAGQQVRGQGDDLGPGHVNRPVPGGPAVQAQCLGLFDVVLHVDVGAVAGIQPGDLPDAGVGGDQLVAAPELFFPFGGSFAVACGIPEVSHLR